MNDFRNTNINDLKGKPAEVFTDVPEDYFEKLPEKIISRISIEKKQRAQRLKIYTLSGIAAGLLILLGFSFLIFLHNPDKNAGRQMAKNTGRVMLMKDSLLKDILIAAGSTDGDTVSENSYSAAQSDAHDNKKYITQSDIFDELDAIPVEVIFEYLDKHDEFEF